MWAPQSQLSITSEWTTGYVDVLEEAQVVGLARQYEESLVVMTSRGKSGLGRALLGSVADRAVCSSAAPLLLVRSRP